MEKCIFMLWQTAGKICLRGLRGPSLGCEGTVIGSLHTRFYKVQWGLDRLKALLVILPRLERQPDY